MGFRTPARGGVYAVAAGVYALAVAAVTAAEYVSEISKLERGVYSDTFDPYLLTWLMTFPSSLVTAELVGHTLPPTPGQLVARALLLVGGGLVQAGVLVWLVRALARLRPPAPPGAVQVRAREMGVRRRGTATLPGVLLVAGALAAAVLGACDVLLGSACPPSSVPEVRRLATLSLYRAAPPRARQVHLDESTPCAGDPVHGGVYAATYTAPAPFPQVASFYPRRARTEGWREPASGVEPEGLCVSRALGRNLAAVLTVTPRLARDPAGEALYLVDVQLAPTGTPLCWGSTG